MSSQNDKVKVILVTSDSRRGVHLPTDITYVRLLSYVGKKFDLHMDHGYGLSYKLQPNDYPMEITDDEELAFFIESAHNVKEKPIELLVLQPSVSQQFIQNPYFGVSSSQYHHPSHNDQAYQNTDVRQTFFQYLNAPLFKSPPSYQNAPYNPLLNTPNIQPFIRNQHYETQHHVTQPFQEPRYDHYQTRDPNTYDVGTSQKHSYDKGKSKEESEEEAEQQSGEESGEAFGEESGDQSGGEFGEETGESKQHVSDGDKDDVTAEYVFPHEWQKHTFSNMPEPLPTPCLNINQTIPNSNSATTRKLAEGQWFLNKKNCQKTIARKSIEDGYEFKVRKSDNLRYDVICVNKECQWKILTHRAKHGDAFWVSTLYDIHTCSKIKVKPKHRNAYKEVLGDILMEKLRDPNRVYRPKDIIDDIDSTYHITISYQQAWRGKSNALEKLRGGHEESFNKLPYYLYNLKLKNPGSITDIKTDYYGRFEMCFVAIGASVSYEALYKFMHFILL